MVVEVKPGEEVVSVNVGWTVERFVEEEKKEPSRKAQGASGKKKAAPKKSASAKKTKSVKKAVAKKASKTKKKK